MSSACPATGITSGTQSTGDIAYVPAINIANKFFIKFFISTIFYHLYMPNSAHLIQNTKKLYHEIILNFYMPDFDLLVFYNNFIKSKKETNYEEYL